MKYFKIKSDVNKSNWYVILSKDINHQFNVISSLNQGLPPSSGIPLRMELKELESSNRPKFEDEMDMLYWKDDLMFEAFLPSVMNGTFFVISKRLKNTLSSFQIPSHFCYPLDLFYRNDKISSKYFLLYIKGIFYDQMNFWNSDFKVLTKNRPRKLLYDLDKGTINSKKDYSIEFSKVFREGKFLSIDSIAFNCYFDILWGLPNLLYVNEVVKNKLVDLNMKNIIITHIENQTFKMPNTL